MFIHTYLRTYICRRVV